MCVCERKEVLEQPGQSREADHAKPNFDFKITHEGTAENRKKGQKHY